MQITDMNWMQLESYLKQDDRCVLPLGSTEQHGYLSLSTDSLLAERVGRDAAEPLGIPVFPVLAYGITPGFRAFPGSPSVRVQTYLSLVRDLLDSIAAMGFRRILLVNGHGGNSMASGFVGEWMCDNPGVKVKFHSWWNAPQTWAKVAEIDPVASHASWMENFPWTRLPGVDLPDAQKPMFDAALYRMMTPEQIKAYLGDGNFGGRYFRSDEEMLAIWQAAVAETRALLTDNWG